MQSKNYKQKQKQRQQQQQKVKAYLKPETVVIIKQVFLGFIVFSVVGLIISGVWYGTRLEKLSISNIEVKDGPTIKGEVVKEQVLEVLEGEYFHLIPHRFVWFYPKQEIIKNLEALPKIKSLTLEEKTNQTLAISFEEYKPYALWCDLNEHEQDCLFLDKNGFAFDTAPKLLGNNLIRFYLLGEKPISQKFYLETEDFKKIEQVVNFLNKINWYVTKIETDKALDVFLTLGEGGEIKISLREDVSKTFSFLESLRESKEFSHLEPGNFRYVDLRYGSKLYVNENLDMQESEEEKKYFSDEEGFGDYLNKSEEIDLENSENQDGDSADEDNEG